MTKIRCENNLWFVARSSVENGLLIWTAITEPKPFYELALRDFQNLVYSKGT